MKRRRTHSPYAILKRLDPSHSSCIKCQQNENGSKIGLSGNNRLPPWKPIWTIWLSRPLSRCGKNKGCGVVSGLRYQEEAGRMKNLMRLSRTIRGTRSYTVLIRMRRPRMANSRVPRRALETMDAALNLCLVDPHILRLARPIVQTAYKRNARSEFSTSRPEFFLASF